MLTFPILLVLMFLAAPPDKPWNGNAPVSDATTKIPELQDDAWGECPAFSHKHAKTSEVDKSGAFPLDPVDTFRDFILDGLCHDDETDAPIGARKVLPNPRDKWL